MNPTKTALFILSWLVTSFASTNVLSSESLPIKENTASSGPVHGFAMHGEPKYKKGFSHYSYVNPMAPKHGHLQRAEVSDSFDSFNPFVIKGAPAAGIGNQYETLMKRAGDEAFTYYGLVAETIEVANNRSWVEFKINPKARFHDNHPITAEDVEFTFKMLTEDKRVKPFYGAYYSDVKEIVIKDQQTIRFNFKNDKNKELPLILAELVVLPKHFYETNDFGKANLNEPLGSGPYKLKSFDAGRSVTWERVKDYWAADLPVNVGFYNFDLITYEYYKDNTVALEAFKSGEFDFRQENTARNWANAYVGPKFSSREIIKEEVGHSMPAGMQAFVMNTRKSAFSDRNVREAIAYAFDFEWTNANLFYSQYKRTHSYFENSELASSGLPSAAELEILLPFKNQLPEEVFSKEYIPPSTSKPSSARKNLKTAVTKLKAAGWEIENRVLKNKKTGEALSFEIMIFNKDWERILQPFVQNLQKLGINASIRLVDTTQYINRLQTQDFDMFVNTIGQSNSPGNEQRAFWHSETANLPGTRNYIGIKNKVIDALIEKVISAPDRDSLVNFTKALDRVLLWGHYVVPNWHNPNLRVAYKASLQKPDNKPQSGIDLDTWWFKQ